MKAIPFAILVYHTIYAQCELAYTDKDPVRVNKCCNEQEIFWESSCNYTTTFRWQPLFTSETGIPNVQVKYKYVAETQENHQKITILLPD